MQYKELHHLVVYRQKILASVLLYEWKSNLVDSREMKICKAFDLSEETAGMSLAG
jgi:hypothetical protein